jgi:membrane-associated phospholipid phosphatase
MFSALESGIGLDVVVWLQANGNPLLDMLGRLFHYLGLPVFYMPVLALAYWSLDKNLGRRMLFALVLSLAVVTALKLLFKAPRPYQAFPDLVIAKVFQTGYGIPSGHVSDSLVVWGYVVYTLKRRWLWGLLALYVGLMAWSRMYVGVHYPQDVIAGLFLGMVVLWVFVRIADPVEAAWHRLNLQTQIAVVLLHVIVMVSFLFGSDDGMAAAGALLGSGLGYILETHVIKFTVAGSALQRIVRYLIGIILALVLFFGMDALFEGREPADILRIARYAAVTLFAVAIWPWLMGRLGLSRDLAEPVPAGS